MKVLLIITFLASCAGTASAQTVADAPPGVVVLRLKWREESYRFTYDPPYSAANKTLEGTPADPPKATGRVFPPINERDVLTKQIKNDPTPPKPHDRRSSTRIHRYVYEVKIRNAGAKRIEALKWEYVFVDPVTKKELDKHSFDGFGRIKPNKSSTLVGVSASPPTKIVTVSGLEKDAHKPFDERVVIACALYSDGTVWKNPSREDADCADLKERAQERER